MAGDTGQPLPVTIDDIRAAAERIAPYIHHTPLLASAALSAMVGCELRFKGEHLQRGGSFKIRGALNKLLALSARERQRGAVAFRRGTMPRVSRSQLG